MIFSNLGGVRRAFIVAAAGLSLGAADAAAQTLPSARQVIDRYLEAVGGPALLRRQNARHMVSEMSMPAAGMNMTMEIFQARPNRILTRMEMPGMGTVASGFDGTVAWSTNPMQGARVLEGAERDQLLQQADFDAGFYSPDRYTTLETVGEKTIGDRACWNVRMVHTSGVETHGCFDKESGLLSGVTASQTSPMGEIEVTSRVEDYRDFEGLKVATRVTSQMMGQEMVMTVKSVSFAPIDDAVFAVPAEVQALVRGGS